MSKILLAEDDARIASFIKRGLVAENYTVDVADNGDHALSMARANAYALIVLDRMLPGRDGMEVCSLLRTEGCESLILMLTAKDRLQDKIDGLRSGADDYLTKPFAFDELIARVEALLRRAHNPNAEALLEVADLRLDGSKKKAWRGQREIALTAKEFSLLSYLMANAGTVLSRPRLLNHCWGMDFDPGTKVVDVYIRYLRCKVDGKDEKPLIKTVRGFGYTLSDEGPP